jgi:Protein of unknown function (DUF664)
VRRWIDNNAGVLLTAAPCAARLIAGTLLAFLRWQRETLELKCSGLSPDDLARRAVEPAKLSLLGLVRHMADVERRWLRYVLAGDDAPPRFSSASEPDGDFDGAVPDGTVVAHAWESWRAEVSFADAFAADTDLDFSMEDSWRGFVSLRWVLVHMVEEYARHNGHADLLRERIDGRVGLWRDRRPAAAAAARHRVGPLSAAVPPSVVDGKLFA